MCEVEEASTCGLFLPAHILLSLGNDLLLLDHPPLKVSLNARAVESCLRLLLEALWPLWPTGEGDLITIFLF
jgi:hypothetical protein